MGDRACAVLAKRVGIVRPKFRQGPFGLLLSLQSCQWVVEAPCVVHLPHDRQVADAHAAATCFQ
eukprot:5614296-Pleurochrysis_carterae.AAC.1